MRGVDDVALQETANWSKRMSTVLVTVFGNKAMHIKPIIVFHGKGTRVNAAEKSSWDPNVHVMFQVCLLSTRIFSLS